MYTKAKTSNNFFIFTLKQEYQKYTFIKQNRNL